MPDLSIDPISLILGVLLSAVAGFLFNHLMKKPKLVHSGGGGGNGRRFGAGRTRHISVTNQPLFLGLNFGPTSILGWELHRPFSWLTRIERDTARRCRATLRLAGTPGGIGPLWWLTEEGFRQEIEIASGERGQLMVFASLPDDNSRYSRFDVENSQSEVLRIPPANEFFTDTEEFIIDIRIQSGRHLEIPVRVERNWRGDFSINFGNSVSSFLQA